MPNGFARKFSPCGRTLLAFTQCVKGIELWQFNGSFAMAKKLQVSLRYAHVKSVLP